MDTLERLEALLENYQTLVEERRKRIEQLEEDNKRLREYERLVNFIAGDYIELSHDKAQWQRDDWYKRCQALRKKGTE